jgi:hypothetical protein
VTSRTPPQPDPLMWPQTDEWIADLIRENEQLKKEIRELRAGVPSVDRTDILTASENRS